MISNPAGPREGFEAIVLRGDEYLTLSRVISEGMRPVPAPCSVARCRNYALRGQTSRFSQISKYAKSVARREGLDALASLAKSSPAIMAGRAWRAGRDSNPRPSGSKPDALSS